MVTTLVRKIIKFMFQRTTLIFILFFTNQFVIAQNVSLKSGGNNLKTKIRQAYHLEQIPDDASYRLEILNINGNITIIGKEGSGGKISITKYSKRLPRYQVESAHKMTNSIVKHIEEENIVRITSDDTLSIEENILEIEMPINLNMQIKINSGDIKLENMRGESYIETLGGDIIVNDFSGDLDLKTNGGNLELEEVNGFIRAHSAGGNININNSEGVFSSSTIGGDIFMRSIKGEINSQSSGGSINLVDVKGEKINCRASGGHVKSTNISSRKAVLHSIGKGLFIDKAEGDLTLRSNGGPIDIKDIRGSLKCEASSGDVKMAEIASRVECINAMGDIVLELLHDSSIEDYNVHLETHYGDVTLDISKSIRGDITSKIYQPNSVKDLNSEIPLLIRMDNEKVIGTSLDKIGDVPINIEAYNGTITIKES